MVLLKRTPIRTFFQIVTPLLLITILVLLRAFKIKSVHKPNVTYPAFDVDKLPPNLLVFDQIAFTPNTSGVQQVMDMVRKQLSFTRAIGFQREEDMVEALVSIENNNLTKAKLLGGVVFSTSLEQKDVIYKIRLSSETRKNGKEKQSNPSAQWLTQFTFAGLEPFGPRNKNASHGGPPWYFEEGFLSIQHAVDVAIIKYKGKIDKLNATVSIKRFPYPDYIRDKFVVVLASFPLLMVLSLTFFAINIFRDVVSEKEKKLKVSTSFN